MRGIRNLLPSLPFNSKSLPSNEGQDKYIENTNIQYKATPTPTNDVTTDLMDKYTILTHPDSHKLSDNYEKKTMDFEAESKFCQQEEVTYSNCDTTIHKLLNTNAIGDLDFKSEIDIEPNNAQNIFNAFKIGIKFLYERYYLVSEEIIKELFPGDYDTKKNEFSEKIKKDCLKMINFKIKNYKEQQINACTETEKYEKQLLIDELENTTLQYEDDAFMQEKFIDEISLLILSVSPQFYDIFNKIKPNSTVQSWQTNYFINEQNTADSVKPTGILSSVKNFTSAALGFTKDTLGLIYKGFLSDKSIISQFARDIKMVTNILKKNKITIETVSDELLYDILYLIKKYRENSITHEYEQEKLTINPNDANYAHYNGYYQYAGPIDDLQITKMIEYLVSTVKNIESLTEKYKRIDTNNKPTGEAFKKNNFTTGGEIPPQEYTKDEVTSDRRRDILFNLLSHSDIKGNYFKPAYKGTGNYMAIIPPIDPSKANIINEKKAEKVNEEQYQDNEINWDLYRLQNRSYKAQMDVSEYNLDKKIFGSKEEKQFKKKYMRKVNLNDLVTKKDIKNQLYFFTNFLVDNENSSQSQIDFFNKLCPYDKNVFIDLFKKLKLYLLDFNIEEKYDDQARCYMVKLLKHILSGMYSDNILDPDFDFIIKEDPGMVNITYNNVVNSSYYDSIDKILQPVIEIIQESKKTLRSEIAQFEKTIPPKKTLMNLFKKEEPKPTTDYGTQFYNKIIIMLDKINNKLTTPPTSIDSADQYDTSNIQQQKLHDEFIKENIVKFYEEIKTVIGLAKKNATVTSINFQDLLQKLSGDDTKDKILQNAKKEFYITVRESSKQNEVSKMLDTERILFEQLNVVIKQLSLETAKDDKNTDFYNLEDLWVKMRRRVIANELKVLFKDIFHLGIVKRNEYYNHKDVIEKYFDSDIRSTMLFLKKYNLFVTRPAGTDLENFDKVYGDQKDYEYDSDNSEEEFRNLEDITYDDVHNIFQGDWGTDFQTIDPNHRLYDSSVYKFFDKYNNSNNSNYFIKSPPPDQPKIVLKQSSLVSPNNNKKFDYFDTFEQININELNAAKHAFRFYKNYKRFIVRSFSFSLMEELGVKKFELMSKNKFNPYPEPYAILTRGGDRNFHRDTIDVMIQDNIYDPTSTPKSTLNVDKFNDNVQNYADAKTKIRERIIQFLNHSNKKFIFSELFIHLNSLDIHSINDIVYRNRRNAEFMNFIKLFYSTIFVNVFNIVKMFGVDEYELGDDNDELIEDPTYFIKKFAKPTGYKLMKENDYDKVDNDNEIVFKIISIFNGRNNIPGVETFSRKKESGEEQIKKRENYIKELADFNAKHCYINILSLNKLFNEYLKIDCDNVLMNHYFDFFIQCYYKNYVYLNNYVSYNGNKNMIRLFIQRLEKYIKKQNENKIFTFLKLTNIQSNDIASGRYNIRYRIKEHKYRKPLIRIGYNDTVEAQSTQIYQFENNSPSSITKHIYPNGDNGKPDITQNEIEKWFYESNSMPKLPDVTDGSTGVTASDGPNGSTDYLPNREYLFGNFSNIYYPDIDNYTIARDEKFEQLRQRAMKGEPIFTFGYGSSGAGKTSALIYYNKGDLDQRNGIITHFCNSFIQYGYKKLELKMKEFYNSWDKPETCTQSQWDIICDSYLFIFEAKVNSFELVGIRKGLEGDMFEIEQLFHNKVAPEEVAIKEGGSVEQFATSKINNKDLTPEDKTNQEFLNELVAKIKDAANIKHPYRVDRPNYKNGFIDMKDYHIVDNPLIETDITMKEDMTEGPGFVSITEIDTGILERDDKVYNITPKLTDINKEKLKAKIQYNNRFDSDNGPDMLTLGNVSQYLVDKDRIVKATTNNQNSSRSHVMLHINIYKEYDERSNCDIGNSINLFVGDFAGVENAFDCKDTTFLDGFLSVERDEGLKGRKINPYYSNEPEGDPTGNFITNANNNNNKQIDGNPNLKRHMVKNKMNFKNPSYENFGFEDSDYLGEEANQKSIDKSKKFKDLDDSNNSMLKATIQYFQADKPIANVTDYLSGFKSNVLSMIGGQKPNVDEVKNGGDGDDDDDEGKNDGDDKQQTSSYGTMMKLFNEIGPGIKELSYIIIHVMLSYYVFNVLTVMLKSITPKEGDAKNAYAELKKIVDSKINNNNESVVEFIFSDDKKTIALKENDLSTKNADIATKTLDLTNLTIETFKQPAEPTFESFNASNESQKQSAIEGIISKEKQKQTTAEEELHKNIISDPPPAYDTVNRPEPYKQYNETITALELEKKKAVELEASAKQGKQKLTEETRSKVEKELKMEREKNIIICKDGIQTQITPVISELKTKTDEQNNISRILNKINDPATLLQLRKDYITKLAAQLKLTEGFELEKTSIQTLIKAKLASMTKEIDFENNPKFNKEYAKKNCPALLGSCNITNGADNFVISDYKLEMNDDININLDYSWLVLLLTKKTKRDFIDSDNDEYISYTYSPNDIDYLIEIFYGDENKSKDYKNAIRNTFYQFLDKFKDVDLTMPFLSFKIKVNGAEGVSTYQIKSSPNGHITNIAFEKGTPKLTTYLDILNYWKEKIDKTKITGDNKAKKQIDFANWIKEQKKLGKLSIKQNNFELAPNVRVKAQTYQLVFDYFESAPVLDKDIQNNPLMFANGVQLNSETDRNRFKNTTGTIFLPNDIKTSVFSIETNKKLLDNLNYDQTKLEELVEKSKNYNLYPTNNRINAIVRNMPELSIKATELQWEFTSPDTISIETPATELTIFPDMRTTKEFYDQRNSYVTNSADKATKILYSIEVNSIRLPVFLQYDKEYIDDLTYNQYDETGLQITDPQFTMKFSLLDSENEYDTKLKDLTAAIEVLKPRLAELENNLKACSEKPEIKDSDIDVAIEKLTEYKSSIKGYEKTIEDQNIFITGTYPVNAADAKAVLQDGLNEATTKHQAILKQIQEITTANANNLLPQAIITQINGIEKGSTDAIAANTKRITEEYAKSMAEYEGNEAKKTAEISRINSEIATLTAEITTLEGDISELKNNINTTSEQRITDLKAELVRLLRDCNYNNDINENKNIIVQFFVAKCNDNELKDIQTNATIICTSSPPSEQCKEKGTPIDDIPITMKTIIDKVNEIINHMYLDTEPGKAMFWTNLLANGKYFGIQNPNSETNLNDQIHHEMEKFSKVSINNETLERMLGLNDANDICGLMGEINNTFLTPFSGNNSINYVLHTINDKITQSNINEAGTNEITPGKRLNLQDLFLSLLEEKGFKLLAEKEDIEVQGGRAFKQLSTVSQYENNLYMGDKYEPLKYNFKNTDFHDFLFETMKKIERTLTLYESIAPICSHRLIEGQFINESLENLRLNFNDIMAVKNRNTVFYSPEFYTDCLSDYCPSKTRCFTGENSNSKIDDLTFTEYMKMKKDKKQVFTSSIIDWIFYNYVTSMFGNLDKYAKITDPPQTPAKKNLQLIIDKMKKVKVKDFYDKMLIAVFCVFNVSCYRNNTPALAFIDSNALKLIYYKYKDLYNRKCYIHKKEEFTAQKECVLNKIDEIIKNIKKETNNVTNKYNGVLEAALFVIPGSASENFVNIFTNMKDTFEKLGDKKARPFDNDECNVIESFIQRLDTYNEATPIGTVQFLDKIAKLNTTNVICDASLTSPCLENKDNIDRDFVLYGLYNEGLPNMCKDSQLKPFIKTQIDAIDKNNITVTMNNQSYNVLKKAINSDSKPILFIPIINKAANITAVTIVDKSTVATQGIPEVAGKEEAGQSVVEPKVVVNTKPIDETYIVQLTVDAFEFDGKDKLVGTSITIEYTPETEILNTASVVTDNASVQDKNTDGGDEQQDIDGQIKDEYGGNISPPVLEKERVRSYISNLKSSDGFAKKSGAEGANQEFSTEITKPEPEIREEYPLVNRSIKRQSSKSKKNKTYKYSAEDSENLAKPLLFKNEVDDDEEQDEDSPRTEEYSKTGKTKKQRVKVRGKTDKNKDKINIK